MLWTARRPSPVARTTITEGPGSRAQGIAIAYKLIEAAQSRWRAVNAPHLVALVRAGAELENGKLVECPDGQALDETRARPPERSSIHGYCDLLLGAAGHWLYRFGGRRRADRQRRVHNGFYQGL